jgi:hypothetical protein
MERGRDTGGRKLFSPRGKQSITDSAHFCLHEMHDEMKEIHTLAVLEDPTAQTGPISMLDIDDAVDSVGGSINMVSLRSDADEACWHSAQEVSFNREIFGMSSPMNERFCC